MKLWENWYWFEYTKCKHRRRIIVNKCECHRPKGETSTSKIQFLEQK